MRRYIYYNYEFCWRLLDPVIKRPGKNVKFASGMFFSHKKSNNSRRSLWTIDWQHLLPNPARRKLLYSVCFSWKRVITHEGFCRQLTDSIRRQIGKNRITVRPDSPGFKHLDFPVPCPQMTNMEIMNNWQSARALSDTTVTYTLLCKCPMQTAAELTVKNMRDAKSARSTSVACYTPPPYHPCCTRGAAEVGMSSLSANSRENSRRSLWTIDSTCYQIRGAACCYIQRYFFSWKKSDNSARFFSTKLWKRAPSLPN